MNKVREIDYDNLTMTVEAGIVTNEINSLIKEKGLFYAGYPMSLETCTLGGNIAENAGGGKAIKYGVTSRYILGLEFVTPQGEVVWLGGKLAKDVTGYDLVHLIVGSEGTLGIVTAAIIRLIALPTAKTDLLALFQTPEAAIACVPKILAQDLTPTSIEFMDRQSFAASCTYLNEGLSYAECGAMLLIEMDGRDVAVVEREAEAVGDLCTEVGAIEVEILDRRIGAVGKQRRPMIIGAHLHPPFVDTDSRRRIDRAIVLIVAARKQSAHAVHHSSPVANIGDVMHRQW